MINPGLLTELKEAVTALMVITVIVSVYGGVKSKDVSMALLVFFAFAAIFSVALWASAVLGVDLATLTTSTGNAAAYYASAAWVSIALILLILTLGAVIVAIIAINEVFVLRSAVTGTGRWTREEVELLVPIAVVRGIASFLKEETRRLFAVAFIYSAITAAYAFYLVFLTR